MSLPAGTRLGRYEILGLVGAGGMGEVYRARDPRLRRDVAVKVLRDKASPSAEQLHRFEQEARIVGSLNHPNVLGLHDVGSYEGMPYIVTELLEGRLVRDILAAGPLPHRKAVECAQQVARGLAAAHERGIVHRDLKPANLFLTKDGQIKILDFGVAKLTEPGPTAGDSSLTLTADGLVFGTEGYMSPEQVRGRGVDARSDIFALGAVVYEMLSGRRAFYGDTVPDTMTAILTKDPEDLSRPGLVVPFALDRIVRRCLEKDPAERFQSARDVAFALEAGAAPFGTASPLEPDVATDARSRRRLWAVLSVGIGASLLFGAMVDRLWLGAREPVRRKQVVRGEIALPPGTMVAGWGRSRTELALSPDGARLVWSAEDTGTRGTALYGLLLDRAEPMRVAGSDGATQPFFSPDGRWVGFYDSRRGKLCRVPVEGGLAADLVDVKRPGPMGAFWSADGRIFLGNFEGGLEWTPAEGGSLRALTHVDRTREMGHRLPWVLPGGRVILFTAPLHGWGVRARVEAVSLTSGARKVLVEDAADARYLASGHLVFARQGSLMAAPFDPDRLELEAPPVPVLDDVRQALNMGNGLMNSGAAQFTVSATGLLVYAKGGILEDTPTELVLVDRVGRAERLPGFDKPLATGQVRFSPDGRQLAFTEAAHGGLAWLFDLERQTHRPLTHDGIAGWPVWSPDGGRIALGWSAAGPLSLWLVPAEGGGGWRRLTEEGGFPASWVPDGRALLFVRDTVDDDDILLCRIADGQVTSLLETRAEEKYPELSPDGRLLAYASNETGRREVFVTSFPDLRRTLVVSHSGGDSPVWSRDGRTLFYLDLDRPDRRLLGVPVIRAEPFALGAPTVLFRLPPGTRLSDPVRGYDVHPDGKRFLFARWKEPPLPPTPVTRLHLVENWFAELDRLSARGR